MRKPRSRSSAVISLTNIQIERRPQHEHSSTLAAVGQGCSRHALADIGGGWTCLADCLREHRELIFIRAMSRQREFAMRVALGASRTRLVRQCVTESAVLGLCGGLLGVMAAALSVHPFVALWPGNLPRAEEIHIDWRVLCFGVGISLVCGLVFGLAPALRVPAHALEEALRSGGRSVTGNSRRLHGPFVIAEIALALVLLVSAGMLGRTVLALSSFESGPRCT